MLSDSVRTAQLYTFAFMEGTKTRAMHGYRQNTQKTDFSVVPTRPSVPDIREFVFDCLKLDIKQIKNLQLTNNNAHAYLEMETAALAEQIVADNNRKYFIASEGKDFAIPLRTADGAVEVKVKDLPPHMPNSTIAKHLRTYGEILSLKDDTWNEHFPGLPNCVRLVRIRLSKAIPSYISIENETAYVRYRNQVPTCKHCARNLHIGSKCSEVRKALSVNSRLTLAEIVKGRNPDMTAPVITTIQPKDPAAQEDENIVDAEDDHGNMIVEFPAENRSSNLDSGRTNAISKVNKTPSADLSPFHGFDNSDGTAQHSNDRCTSKTMVDLEEGWREIFTKRPGSPGLAENSQVDSKRASRSKHRSK